ncbi:MAG: hypothetical protein ABGX04_06480 [Myxococcales bacterium]|nr:hypothetical protein [Myxococcales bacterium]
MTGAEMPLQARFENFLGGPAAVGSPIPPLDAALGRTLLERIDQLKWYLNRYSMELNFLHGALGIDEFLSIARETGFDGVQLHISRSGPRIGLTAESDRYLAEFTEQEGTRKLELALDISTIRREDVNDAIRVANAMQVQTIRPERAPSGLLVRTPTIGGAENAACFSYSPTNRFRSTSTRCTSMTSNNLALKRSSSAIPETS